jgi:tRNA-intron endonuclease
MKKINVNLIKNSFVLEESFWQSLHSKGFGEKVEGIFSLNIYEVLFLIKKEKINVIDSNDKILEFDYILKKFKINLDVFLTYSDLTKKGYSVKSGFRYGVDFRIYEKGVVMGEEHSEWLVRVYSHKNKLNISDFASFNRVSHSTKKKLLNAVVDIENCVTYFESSWTKM